MSRPIHSFLAFAAALALVGSAPVAAQPAVRYKTGTEFYLAYRDAFTKSKTLDDLLPWMSKTRRTQMAEVPKDERTMMFGMIKKMDDHTAIKVLGETPSASGAELQVEAVSAGSKNTLTATVALVKEGTAWKLDKESWKGGI